MRVEETPQGQIVCRIVIVMPDSSEIFACKQDGTYLIPQLPIQRWARPAEQLQQATRQLFGLDVFIVDFLCPHHDLTYCAIAEVLLPNTGAKLTSVALTDIPCSELSEVNRRRVQSMMSDTQSGAAARLGWIGEVVKWVERSTRKKLASPRGIKQLNAGSSFSLIRFSMEDGTNYWFKATGTPNAHEYSITKILYSPSCGTYRKPVGVPTLVAMKPEWNAWLVAGDGVSLSEVSGDIRTAYRTLVKIVRSFARLQISKLEEVHELLSAGAFDHRLETLANKSEELFAFVEEVMPLQTSTKSARVETHRVRRLRAIFIEICHKVMQLGIPDSVVHGDLNCGNIVIGRECQFIDWSEAYIGNPLIGFQYILLLNKTDDKRDHDLLDRVCARQYCNEWRSRCDPVSLEKGLRYMPILAAVSALYGRGDWLSSPQRNVPSRQSFCRTMARHIDRSARSLEVEGLICN